MMMNANASTLGIILIALTVSAPVAEGVICDLKPAHFSTPEPLTLEQYEGRRQSLLHAMDELNAFLERSGSQRAADWRRYLLWNVLEENVRRGLDGDTEELRRVLATFYKPYAGLELPKFVAVRTSLRAYVVATELLTSPDQRDVIAARLSEVRRMLEGRTLVELSPEQVDRLGKLKAWLADAGQARALVACIDQGFIHGNVALRVDQRFLRLALDETYNVVTPVSEYSLGSYVQGQAHTRAHTSILLVPNATTGDVRVAARGRTVVNSTSSQRRVYVNTTLVSDFLVTKRLHFDDRAAGNALQSYPTLPQVTTHGTVNSVYSDRLIGRRIAEGIGWRRAHELMPQAEARASERVARQVTQRLESRLNQVLRNANLYYEEFLGAPLRRIGFGSLRPAGQTTSQQFLASLKLAKFEQLTAPIAPPLAPGSQDLQVSVHETVAVNALDDFLGGRKTDAAEVEAFVGQTFGAFPDALKTGPGVDGYDFTFAMENPVRFAFRNQRVKARLSIERFARRSVDPSDPPLEVYEGPLEVEATYRILASSQGVAFERVGEPEVRFGEPISERLEAFAREKISAIFAPELEVDDLAIRPNRLLSRGATLSFEYGVATQGWLSLGARLTK